ncbi:MAG: J domain-containing protein [Myxococcota bacterium]
MRSRRKNPADLALEQHDYRQRTRQQCDWPGCTRAGEYRAPKSRDNLRTFFHFCLEHVRDYNRGWDFFSGMSQDEIDAYLREDVTWHRPTWPLGNGKPENGEAWRWQDPFDVFVNGSGTDGTHGASEWDRQSRPRTKTERMLAVLELTPDATSIELRTRYKELAKRHHPDLNGGDKKAEERLKLINEAYTYLRDRELLA